MATYDKAQARTLVTEGARRLSDQPQEGLNTLTDCLTQRQA
jgi:hypothetical protein